MKEGGYKESGSQSGAVARHMIEAKELMLLRARGGTIVEDWTYGGRNKSA